MSFDYPSPPARLAPDTAASKLRFLPPASSEFVSPGGAAYRGRVLPSYAAVPLVVRPAPNLVGPTPVNHRH